MAGTTGLEPATSDVTGRRSNQLNYVPASGRQTQNSTRGPISPWKMHHLSGMLKTDVVPASAPADFRLSSIYPCPISNEVQRTDQPRH